MIIYFADRKMNILGKASTGLPKGIKIKDDNKTEEVDGGVVTFECDVIFNDATRKDVEAYISAGNYIFRSTDEDNEFYTIIDSEIDVMGHEGHVYAEDAGMDLLNEIVGPYEADSAHPAEFYLDKFTKDSGFLIGINEIADLTRKLKWEGESTAAERVASIATQFDGADVSYSFDIKNLTVTNKYINIYEKRGKKTGVQLRLGTHIDNIIIKGSVANLATSLRCTGGTPEGENEPITLNGYHYDDGDFYTSGTHLNSRKAVEQWSRYNWEQNQVEGYEGHLVKRFSYNTVSQKTLCNRAISELKKIRDSEVNYEASIIDLPPDVKIGDRVNIIDENGEFYLEARLLKLETSEVAKKKKATFGEYILKSSGIDSRIEELAKQFSELSANRPLYTWTAYADDESGAGISLDPTDKSFMGTANNQVSREVDISNPRIFTWVRVEGEQGKPGDPGAPGISIQSQVKEYYLSTSPVEVTGGAWSTEQPEWEPGKYIWSRFFITWTDDTTSYSEPIVESAFNNMSAVIAEIKATAVTTEYLSAHYATIGEFNAIKGKVETLETNSLTAEKADLLYAKIGELTALKGKFDELETKSLTAEKADLLYAKIGELTALSGKFDTLSSKAITAEYLEANYTKTVNLEATYAKIQQLEAVSGRFGDISADKTVTEYLEANYTDMKTFTALKGVVDDLNANKITTGYLEANYASLSALNATVADIGALKANKVDVSKANIDEAWIKDLLVKGKFLANDINAATGSFSHYLTGVNIVGDNITGGTISTERLIIRDKDGKTGILFELNNGIIDQTGLTEAELKKHALNGQIIVAQSITADKINVTDLFAQDIMATGSITGMKMLSTYIEAEAGRIGVFGIDNIGLHSETSGLVARYDGTSPYMVYADPVRIHEQTTFVVTQPLDARVFARCRYKAETIEFSNVPQQVKLQSGEGAYITSVTKLKIKLIRLNDNYAGAYDVTENWNDVDTVLPNTTKVEIGWEICATGQRYYNDKNTGYVHDEPIYWYADLPNATNEDYTLRLLWSFFRPQLEVYAVPADVGIFPHELRYGDFRVNSLGEAYGMTAEVGNVSNLLATTEFVKNAMTWNNLQGKPSSFVPSAHTHDDRYFTETEMNSKLAAYAQTGHTHDDRYFTETEINSKLSGYTQTGHTHDGRYFTESEINNLLSGKQNNLGYTPIQQGGGTDQGTNKIYIGWTGSKLNAQVDVTNFGAIAFESWVRDNYSASGHKHSAVDITGGALKVSEVNITAARSAQAFKIIDSSNAKNYLAAYLHNNNVAAVLGYYKDGAEANFISLRNDDTRFGKPVAVGSGGTGQNHVSDTFECAAVNTSNVEISNQTCKYFPYLGLVMIRLTVYVHDISVGAEEFFSVVQVPSKYTNNSFIPLATATGTAPLTESMIYPENHASHARLIRIKCNKAWKLGYFYIQGAYLL